MAFEKKNNQMVWVGLSFLAVGLMAGLWISQGSNLLTNVFGLGGEDTQNTDDTSDVEPTVDVATLQTVDVSVDDDAMLGDPNAPVTLVEFSDFQCPYCHEFYEKTFGQLKSDYIDTGKVKLVYRDFPLSGHKQANLAAQAAECVRSKTDDEAYFKFHDWLFENVVSWSGQQDAEDQFVAAAKDELGVDIQTCLDKGQMADEVDADLTAGRSYGVGGTPTFFINGKELVGAWPYSVFQKVIDSQL